MRHPTWTPRLAVLCLAVISSAGGQASADQKAAMDALQKLGAQFQRDESNQDKPIVGVEINNPMTGDVGLARLKMLTTMQTLILNATAITDAGLEHLNGLEKLRQLSLSEDKITDKGLVHLRGLTSLQMLHLEKTKVTDTGVYDLKRLLPNLKVVR